jgi:hypothetical protein
MWQNNAVKSAGSAAATQHPPLMPDLQTTVLVLELRYFRHLFRFIKIDHERMIPRHN